MRHIPPSLRNGTYYSVMRVNGRAVMGLGHTITESRRNTWQAARTKWPQYETVFDYLQGAGYTVEVSA